ncbi:MAG: hypothetical protein PVI59_05450 [Anaerolineae bacterium]|jgi:hypothetical protein
MFRETIEMSATPHITVIDCLGDLVVRAVEGQQVDLRLQGTADDLSMERTGESIALSARTGCIVTCPPHTTLTLQAVHGDLKVRGIEQPITAGKIYGDVVLRDVGPTALETVYGDLVARQVTGDLQAEVLQADARIVQVDGHLRVDRVGGDLRAEGLMDGLEASGVGADVRLGPPFSPGATYRVQAGSDLRIYLPGDASVQLTLQAAGRIQSRMPDLELQERAGTTEVTLGAGEATLEARVGGHVYLSRWDRDTAAPEDLEFSFAADLEGLGSLIELRITEAMAEMQTRLEDSLGQFDSEAVQRRMERAAEKMRWKTEKAAEKARLRMEREAERARMQAERAERRWRRFSGEREPTREVSVSDEERLRVLRLVEKGQISPDEAADLLAALEGR